MNSIIEAAQARLDELRNEIAQRCEQAQRRIELRYRQDLAELQSNQITTHTAVADGTE